VRQLLRELPSPSPVPANPRLLVLVENVEHAQALARLLPGWTLLTGQDLCTSGLGKKDRQLLQAGKKTWPSLRAVLATATALQHIDLSRFDVVLRADGGTGTVPFPASPSLPSGRPVRPLFLVDLDDKHHPLLRRWSRGRLGDYEERGWLAPGRDKLRVRVERFLERCLEGLSRARLQ
jgi:hypothetical protein